MFHEKLTALEFEIADYSLEPLQLATSGGWTRHTTVIHLRGLGLEGVGEDVTYAERDQKLLQQSPVRLPIQGTYTLASFSRKLDSLEPFPAQPAEPAATLYRRWGFESAALDLALRQNNANLADLLGINPQPVKFVISLGLGNPPSTARIRRIQKLYPGAQFKVDLAENWTPRIVEELAGLDAISTVDLKGQYRGDFKGPAADPDQYRYVAEGLPDAWLEDPAWEGGPREALEPFQDRITWDAIIHSVADIVQLPFKPSSINIKPSRFGFLSELLRVYEYCESQGIAMYGGGQFELGPGRGQIQYLASLFHPAAHNDVAPSDFNREELETELATSPLATRPARTGFTWDTKAAE